MSPLSLPNKLVFATSNSNKVQEVNGILRQSDSGSIPEILSLKAIGCNEDIPETASTIEGNAIIKARYIKDNYGRDCFAEDTGLEIDALHGEPGVYTARYAGPARDADANMSLVLEKLKHTTDRSAQFRTAIAIILDGETHVFEGIVRGSILLSKTGDAGFGYDPIFQPAGYRESFAEMAPDLKNRISHRFLAMEKMLSFLKKKYRTE